MVDKVFEGVVWFVGGAVNAASSPETIEFCSGIADGASRAFSSLTNAFSNAPAFITNHSPSLDRPRKMIGGAIHRGVKLVPSSTQLISRFADTIDSAKEMGPQIGEGINQLKERLPSVPSFQSMLESAGGVATRAKDFFADLADRFEDIKNLPKKLANARGSANVALGAAKESADLASSTIKTIADLPSVGNIKHGSGKELALLKEVLNRPDTPANEKLIKGALKNLTKAASESSRAAATLAEIYLKGTQSVTKSETKGQHYKSEAKKLEKLEKQSRNKELLNKLSQPVAVNTHHPHIYIDELFECFDKGDITKEEFLENNFTSRRAQDISSIFVNLDPELAKKYGRLAEKIDELR